jgi:hypothetical protein
MVPADNSRLQLAGGNAKDSECDSSCRVFVMLENA